MTWDPDRYLNWADHRMRPGLELLARVPDEGIVRIVDLGCGTGALTAAIVARWPDASVTGVDASAPMVERARLDHPTIDFVQADITGWEPKGKVDLIYSNAALHWLGDHEKLFARLRSWLSPRGVLAVQMPDNWWEPTHRVPAEVLESLEWPERARTALMEDRVASPAEYAAWVQPAEVDAWRTTYYQHMAGEHPVWDWVTSTLLRPVLESLEGDQLDRFERLCQTQYREAYPPDEDGLTTLPFSRYFLVARAG